MYFCFFPESVWAKGSSNSGGLSSHLIITYSSHIFSSSSHLHICHHICHHILSSHLLLI
jgi:hypothetical protein